MNDAKVTYRILFRFLQSLDFQQHAGKARPQALVFIHEPTDTLLAFGRGPDEPVTPADMLSTEVHLQAKGIVAQPLESLFAASPIKSKRSAARSRFQP